MHWASTVWVLLNGAAPTGATAPRVCSELHPLFLGQGAVWDAISSLQLIFPHAGIPKSSFPFQKKGVRIIHIVRRAYFMASRISMVEERNSNKCLTTYGKEDPEGNIPPHIYKNLLDTLLWLVWSRDRSTKTELPKDRSMTSKNNYARNFCI